MKKLKFYNFILMVSVLFFTCFIISSKVDANSTNDTYFENKNGVVFSKNEYDFISKMYWDGYQSFMTIEEYNDLKKYNLMNQEVEIIFYEAPKNMLVPFSTSISSADKSLKMSKACTTNCVLVVTLSWLRNPTVRSYDVIGAYLDGTTFVGTPTTVVVSDASRVSITDLKKTSNGIGSSFKLPSGSNIKITQTFRVNKGGHVYASYQHAMSNSSLAISKDYSFSKLGYGSVFSFSQNAKKYYDGMGGVDMEV